MKVSIVMPAYNEAECIESVVKTWAAVASRHDGSVLVVDDGSRDETPGILDRLAEELDVVSVLHQPNGGHGTAILHGYREALARGSEYVFQVDSDDQFHAEDFDGLWNRRKESPFILGYREVRHDARHRLWISKTLAMLVMLLFQVRIKDANIPYRLMEASFLRQSMALVPDGVFAPNIFLSITAAKAKIDTLDIPITHSQRVAGAGSLLGLKLIRTCMKSTRDLWTFKRALSANLPKLKSLNARQG